METQDTCRTLPGICDVSFGKGNRHDVDLVGEVVESKEASRCVIIELENIQVRVLHLYERNWKGK
jgi:hypothetical protein